MLNDTNIVQHRRGTTEEWCIATVIPATGELLVEECADGSRRCKIGDGIHTFAELSYVDAKAIADVEKLAVKLGSDLSNVNKRIDDLNLEVDGLDGSLANLVKPTIDTLDTKYSARLTEMSKHHEADFDELSEVISSKAKELTNAFKSDLADNADDSANALETKAAALTSDYTYKINSAVNDLNRQLIASEKTLRDADASLSQELVAAKSALSSSIVELEKNISALEAKDTTFETEIANLKNAGYGSTTADMIARLKALESSTNQLSTNDISVVTKLYAVEAAVTRLNKQVDSLKAQQEVHSADIKNNFSELKKNLRDADTALLNKVNEDLVKLWAEITDLVDDDVSLYNQVIATSSTLNKKIDNVKSTLENANTSLRTELNDSLKNQETSLKNLIDTKANLSDTTKTTDELSACINEVKSASETGFNSVAKSLDALGADIRAEHEDASKKINEVKEIINTNKTSADKAIIDAENAIAEVKNDLKNTDADLSKAKTAIDFHAAQINNLTKLGLVEGSTTGDAELTNARIRYDGYTYDTLGEHIADLGRKLADHTDTDAITSLCYDVKGEVGLKQPYTLYLTNADGEILQGTGVQIISGAGGGEGGSGSGKSSLTVETITPQTVTFLASQDATLEFNFSGTDSSGNNILQVLAEWRIGDSIRNLKLKAESTVNAGYNSFDVTKYLTGSSTVVQLTVIDANGRYVSTTWNIKRVDLALELDFKDKQIYTPDNSFTFNYTPTGTITKYLIVKLNNNLLRFNTEANYTVELSSGASGQSLTYENKNVFKSLKHGIHTIEVYLDVPELNTRTESIFKNIMVKEPNCTDPLISIEKPSTVIKQYGTVNIVYTVYDPKKELPIVDIYLDDSSTPIINNKEITLNSDYYNTPTAVYTYNALEAGQHKITIKCGNVSKTLEFNVESIDTNLSPVTEGLVFDFNPALGDNSNHNWSDGNVVMQCSNNFDWSNGGYKEDENGDRYFCIKAGTTATINYELFADNAKNTGKEFKVIFKTTNVRQRDTSFLKCLDKEANIGIDMQVEHATIYDSSTKGLRTDYCEDAIIEYEFNIHPATDMPLVMSYEDGTPSKPYEYTTGSSFTQTTTQPITIGSEDCDVYIYRIKTYDRALLDTEIKNNFIADARNIDEKLKRYNRNNIYDDGKLVTTSADGSFSVGPLMAAAPDLRYVFLEVPQFTNDKDNKIDGCTVYFRYPAGTRPQDNWTCTGVRHRGQGTSSNAYGYAGRNMDLCMDRDESLFTWQDKDAEGNNITRTGSKITLTDDSVPTDYLNIKVNIASSENANNAELARRFNEYQPFLRYARKKDDRVKDTMEFYNCVVFIRETSTDTTKVPHREFDDNNWHFYAIGNIGDSKKTDDTRVNNAKDPKEHVVEIMDVDVPLAAFPKLLGNYTYKYLDSNGVDSSIDFKHTTDAWAAGNTAYDLLHSDAFCYELNDKGELEFKSFGGTSFEFRYEMSKISDEQRMANITAWRNFYDFVVTSTDEAFYANLKDYFVVDSALYYYLFTERYTMVDNRAKNSFWHYGKAYYTTAEAEELRDNEGIIIDEKYIDDVAADESHQFGYRYDLTFGYDMDTALGIDNTGDYVFAYGKEDTDYYRDGDPTSGPVFRADTSTFFCKLRDLFKTELRTMFRSREDANAWRSDALISQWDTSQSKFPEELWRLDYERKYYRTYRGVSIDNSIKQDADKTFLIGKFFGRKKYARRAFETNQEIYFATKYFGKTVASDSDTMWIRGTDITETEDNGKQNYSITITPYLDMYPLIKYGSTGSYQHGIDENGNPVRLKAGQTYTFVDTAASRDFIYIGAPKWIQVIGDLSKCYIGDSSFAKGLRLQSLILGDNTEGYTNSNLKAVSVTSNTLLEYLDLSNVTGLEGELDLTTNINLKTLKAFGTTISGVDFATGGKIAQVELPATVTKITLKDLKYLNADPKPEGSFDVSSVSYFDLPDNNKVQSLTIEKCPNFTLSKILDKFKSLKKVRLCEMSFGDYTYDAFSEYFDKLKGIDGRGDDTDAAYLDGTIHFTGELEGGQYNKVTSRYPSLEITYDKLVSKLHFMQVDGETVYATDEDTDFVTSDNNEPAEASRPDDSRFTPRPEMSDDKGEFAYSWVGWTSDKDKTIVGENIEFGDEEQEALDAKAFKEIKGDRVLYPVFKQTRRNYTVTFVNPDGQGSSTTLHKAQIPYGECPDDYYTEACPEYSLPTIIPKEHYTFIGWANSSGTLVNEITTDITLYAQFAIEDTTWHHMSITDISNPSTVVKKGYILDDTNNTMSIIYNSNTSTENKLVNIPREFTIGDKTYTVTSVGGFYGHPVEVVKLPDTTTEIGESNKGQGAFESCSNLVTVELQSSRLSKIKAKAFFECSSLEEFLIHNSVKDIGDAAFAGCPSLNLSVEAGGRYSIIDNCLVDNTSYKLLQALPGATSMPDNTESLGNYCFYKTNITSIKIPDEVEGISDNAFNLCSSLTEVELPNNIKTLGATCFSGCNALKTINLPEGLTEIKTYVFSGCALESVIIPSTVTKIGTNAFSMSTLKNVDFTKHNYNSLKTLFSANNTHESAFSGTTGITFKLPITKDKYDELNTTVTINWGWGAKNAKLVFSDNSEINL